MTHVLEGTHTHTTPKTRPIIFGAKMISAILEGRKTMTRRVIKPQPHQRESGYWWFNKNCFASSEWLLGELMADYCPYGSPGDMLYVRETWAAIWPDITPVPLSQCNIEYRADSGAAYPGEWPEEEARGNDDAPKWRSPIFMPKALSRITLEIVSVRVEQLQSISEEDARAEGIDIEAYHDGIEHADAVGLGTGYIAQDMFRELWDSINASRGFGWDTNCWVWCVEFRRVTP